MKYTNITKIENYLLTEIDLNFEAQVEEWIDAVEKYIDNFTRRNFKADTSATAKKYDGIPEEDVFTTKGRKELEIDDCVEITELKIGDDTIAITDYLIYPANSLPKTRIKLKDDNSYAFEVGDEGGQNIQVKAKWGYSASPPADIIFAATVLVSGIINYSRGVSAGKIRTETIGNYSISYADERQWQDFEQVQKILENYQKITF